jgi:hypothetical protein
MAVSVSWFSTITSHFSFARAATIFSELGPVPDRVHPEGDEALWPRLLASERMEWPRYMSSNMYAQE